jgi:hypothetical protein
MKQLPVLLSLPVLIALLTQPPRIFATPQRTRHRVTKSTSEDANRRVQVKDTVRNLLLAHDELPPTVWKRLLEVQNSDGEVLAHYLIFDLHGTFFSYSPEEGSRRIWPASKSATAFAHAVHPGSGVIGIFFAPSSTVASNNSHFPEVFGE